MRKKINNLSLAIIFIVMLLLVMFLFMKKGGHNERSFNRQLVEFNTDKVTRMVLFPKSMNAKAITINKEEEDWKIEVDDTCYRADRSRIDGMLSGLHELKAKSLVANSEERWSTYEVNDSLASRVQLFDGSKKIVDVYIGKFKHVQNQSISTYVRISGAKETYRVDGYLTGEFNRKVNDLRDKTILKDPKADWTKISFDYPADSSFVLTKNEKRWMLDGVMADSAAVVKYINTVRNQDGRQIVDLAHQPGVSLYHLKIERANLDPIELDVREYVKKKVIESSENRGVWFDDQNLFDRVFVAKSKFGF
jgi:hypothetical protein